MLLTFITVERLRSLGDESKLKNLKAELAKRKERKKQLEESAASNKSKVGHYLLLSSFLSGIFTFQL